MDITIYLYHNNRIFYDMDIPANSSICNECDNRTYIKFIDIVMWTLRRDALYARKKTMDIRIKDRPLGGDAIAVGTGAIAAFTVENIYDNKRNDIYYGENLNSSNYDKQDFEKRLNKILMLKIDWEFKT